MIAWQRLALACCIAVLNGGCWVALMKSDEKDDDQTEVPADWDVPDAAPDADWDPPPRSPPPSVVAIDVPEWPPLGPTGEVTVTLQSTEALSTIEYGFRNHLVRSPSERTVTGLELGEGFGNLVVRATDVRGAFASREVTDLLVDLSPPEITLTETIISAQGKLAVWVADAWILGLVELDFAGVHRSHQFQVGYPETLGTTWDVSLVEFRADEFPATVGPARITATDAAGNEVQAEFDLVIDGTPPTVTFIEPALDTVVVDELRVTLEAHDEGELPVVIELVAGGAHVATAAGPVATLVLDPRDFPPGPLALEATALDAAGNASVVAVSSVVVDVQPLAGAAQ